MKKSRAKASHRVHVIYTGRVQGVGFRHLVEGVGQRLLVTGWVKNLRNGSVEMVCEGSKEKVDALLLEVKEGPLAQYIKNVQCAWEPPSNSHDDFIVEFDY